MKPKPRALRWIALLLGLAAFGMHVAYTFWLQPLTWHVDLGIGLLMMAAAYLVSVGLPFGVLSFLAGWRPPARLDPREGALVAPHSPTAVGALVILLMWISGGGVITERVPDEYAMRVADFELAGPISLAMIGVIWMAALIAVLVERPRVEFTADALIIRDVVRANRLEWERLAPGGPLPPRKRQRYLRLYLNEPPLLGSYPPSVDIRLALVHVDPVFLADTIRRYVENPEQRAALPGGGKPQGAPSI